jgi:hypothetical protein
VKTRQVKTKLPDDFEISDDIRRWATEKGHGQLEARLEHFVGYCRANGKTYLDWDQAFQNAVRDDWAKLNGKPGAQTDQRSIFAGAV